MKTTEVKVIQRPIGVQFKCPRPNCNHVQHYHYPDFLNIANEPDDWDGTVLACEKCGKEFEIDGQDWG